MSQPTDEVVHSLPSTPVHLFQHSQDPKTYNNPMGCGAFSTAMALSCYNPRQYGSYDVARFFFSRMLKVPGFGGTFESQNARIARLQGFIADSFDKGTFADLAAAIDLGAPTIILINPGKFGIGTHDVLLVGYSTDSGGNPKALFINNPAVDSATQPGGYPGNQTIPVSDMGTRWTRVFTPFFADEAQQGAWLQRTGRAKPAGGLLHLFG